MVVVATVRALKMHGGIARGALGEEDVAAVERGFVNLGRHLDNVAKFGVPAVVAVNRFTADTDAEIAAVQRLAAERGASAHVCTHWADGGAGTESLAQAVAALADSGDAEFTPVYPDGLPLWEKIETVAREIYRADGAEAPARVKDQLERFEAGGFGHVPVCMAKTQYSFSSDPTLRGAPEGYSIPVREVRLAAGAEFVVAVCGDIMTMPGLPRVPAAEAIGLDEGGEVVGLF